MALEAPIEGEIKLLEYIVHKTTPPTDVILHLYQTPQVTITGATVLADITEAVDGSYAAVTLTGATWTVEDVGSLGTATYPEQTFTFGAGQTVFGYYVTEDPAVTCLWIEEFSGAPFTLPGGGGTIGISPKITLN